MKKNKITIAVIIAVLFFLFGCSGGGEEENNTVKVQGNVIILQAYGNAGDGSPAGVSHSFVELYNIFDRAISLEGVTLYYANGIRSTADVPEVTEDEAWKQIALSGTIPAKGSFLVLGAKHDNLSNTRYKIDDGYGDINDSNLSLNRRSFKVALISGSAELTVQNPFIFNNGRPISGYIDMVGAVNNPDTDFPDHIFGFETAPTRNSASAAVRRKNLIDTDNNFNDFIAARYALTGEGAFTDEMLEVRKPRNSSAGEWNPFEEPAEPPAPPPPPDITGVDYSKLKLNEVSGVGGDSEKFYELINIGDKDIPLYDCKIYYNANGSTGGTLPAGKGNVTWTGLTSQTIEAGDLFSLIGRDNPPGAHPGSFTTGLTAARILIITLEDPEGNVIDQCIRAEDTGLFAFTDKSFSRIPDGTGDFYFTTPTPNAKNGTSATGLTKLPVNPLIDPPVISNLHRDPVSVTPADKVTVSATVTTTSSAITTVVLQWTLNGIAQNDIIMTESGDVYSAIIQEQAVDSIVTYKISAANNLGETTVTAVQNYIVVDAPIDYSKLVLNEISGNNKFVEIYNSGAVAIPLQGVKLQRNDGQSEWVGTASDSIPAGAYRIFLFNSYTPADLNTNPACVGWTVNSGISSGQILKVAIIDPADNPIDVFIRGDNPLPAWGNSTSIAQDTTNSYSRMDAATWAYAAPTPGAANGAKAAEIVSPGYLTAQRTDPPALSGLTRDPSSVTPADTVTVSVTVKTTASAITNVVLNWTLNGTEQSGINMPAAGNVYSAAIPAQTVDSTVTYKVSATNNLGDTAFSATQNYTVNSTPAEGKLLILQANSYGNNNGGAAGFAKSLVELYNNTDAAIDLTAGNYYLHIGNATAWTYQIKLTGTIPAKCSFLIVTTNSGETNATPRATLPAADFQADFVLINNNIKIALMKNQSAALSVNNPFGNADLSADYVDMVGCGTTNGYETTAAAATSRPQGIRRKSLTDTDNNSVDFGIVDYRGYTGSNGMPDSELYKFWPRNAAAGAWDPITGLPKIDPVVP